MSLQYFTIRINVTGTAALDGATLFTGTPVDGEVEPQTGIVLYDVPGPVGVFDLAALIGVFNFPLVIQGISVENTVNPHSAGSRVDIQSPPRVDSAARKSALAFLFGGTNGLLPQTNFIVPVDHRITIDTTPDGGAPGPHVIQFSIARANDATLNTLLANRISSIAPQNQWINPARAASSANHDIATLAPGSSVDGVVLASGDSVILKTQTDATQNGVYTIQDTAPAVRRKDFSSSSEIRPGLTLAAQEGTINPATAWCLISTTPRIRLGATILGFAKLGGAPGGINFRAGDIGPGAFSGIPPVATVSFTSNMPNALYLPVIGYEVVGNRSFVFSWENRTISGFDIVSGSNNLAGLSLVSWHVLPPA